MVASEDNGDVRLTIGQVVDRLSAEYPDITHSSLRFLEREGLITPDRTMGGHRLFPMAQVARIRTIKSWQRQRLSLEEIRQRLSSADQLPDTEAQAQEFLRLLIAGEREAAQRLILNADDRGMPLLTIFDGILRPVLHETGELWARGDIPVGQEKEISAFCRDLIALLSSRHRMDRSVDKPSIVAGCVAGEYHELGLRMITAILRERGYLVHYLGPSVDADFLVERVLVRRPRAVVLSAIQSERQPALMETVDALLGVEESGQYLQVLVGGAGVPPASEFAEHPNVQVIEDSNVESVINQIEDALS